MSNTQRLFLLSYSPAVVTAREKPRTSKAEVRAAPPCPFVSCTFFLTREPTRGSLLGLLKESAGKRLRWKAKWTRQGEKARKREKDTILTERTYRSSANKGLSFLKRQKRTGF